MTRQKSAGRAAHYARAIFGALILSLILLFGLTGASFAQEDAPPGGPSLCQANDGSNGGQQSAVVLAQNRARANAQGEAATEHASHAQVELHFIPTISYSADLQLGVTYSGLLEGFGGGNLNRGHVRIEASLRDVVADLELDSQLILDKTEKGKPLQGVVTVVTHDVFNQPVAEFEADLVQGREYAVILRLETDARGINAQSDFFTGNRGARFGCLSITPDLVDTDGDSLYDAWEVSGIDVDGDGDVDYDLTDLGADFRGIPITLDPNRKDILVEVDWFDCGVVGGDCAAGDTHSHQPRDDALEIVRQAFADAPVSNPAGGPGINLWVQVDQGLAHQQNCDLDSDGCFDAAKALNFGTPAEQGNPDGITAKGLAFRYNVWVHDKNTGNTSSGEADGSAGISGDDFVVSLGSWTGSVGTLNDQAGTFMHELGHTLALGHGGGDNANCKPNHLSVMSYIFQVVGLQPAAIFDYSRKPLPAAGSLIEDELNEPIGLEDGGFTTFYGPPNDVDGVDQGGDGNPNDDWIPALGLGPIDWDFDSDNTENPAAPRDLNFLGITGCGGGGTPDATPDQGLIGYNEWPLLKYNFRDSPFFPAGEHGVVLEEDEELDYDTAEQIKDLVWRGQVETMHEFSAKIVCGDQRDPQGLRLTAGRYATTINIHNPNSESVEFRKKIALSYPPEEQAAGEIRRIGLDTLRYDEALKVDCDDIRRNVFGGSFPAPYIEGFVVIQSPQTLDVTAVYTTAAADPRTGTLFHSSIDVETVRERVTRLGRPDLRPEPTLPTPEEAGLPEGFPGVLYCAEAPPRGGASDTVRVRVVNQGIVEASGSVASLDFAGAGIVSLPIPALDAGAATTLDFAIPDGCYGPGFSAVCAFEITVDAAGQVNESREDNNVAESRCVGPAG